jgi:hypothetical protein
MSTIYLPPGVVDGPKYGTDTWKTARRAMVTASRFGDVVKDPRTIPREFVNAHIHLIPEADRFKVLKSGPRAGMKVEADGLPQMVAEAAALQGAFPLSETAVSYMYEIMAQAVTGLDRVGGRSAAMDRGIDLEQDALDQYATHKFTDVSEGRLLILEGTTIGATPDGFVEDDEEGPGILEVKCPEIKRHLQTYLTRTLPEDYFEQVHGQLWISGRNWCDFVSYDDRFPLAMRLVIIRVYRDEAVIESMSRRVHAFADVVAAKLDTIQGYLAACNPEEQQIVHRALEENAEGVTFEAEAE